MALRPILRWPDERLTRVCAPVAHGSDCRALVADMFETMYAAPGRGLAAPQIGEMRRIFVMDCGWKEGVHTPVACLNPEILDRGPVIAVNEEACLSIPGISAEVPRPAQVTLRWYDPDWTEHRRTFDGFEAVCVQHESDHLDGRLYLDYLSAALRTELEDSYAGQS